MTVFKVYFLIIRRNFAAILMYIGIFAGIAVAIQASFRHTGMTEGFSAMKLDVAVVDRGGGILSETLQEVLGLQHDLVTIADDEQVIQEELYYGNVKYVLIVQDKALEKLQAGEQAVQSITVPGTIAAYYVEAQVNAFLNEIRTALAGGFSPEEACQEAVALANLSVDVKLVDKNGNAGIRENYNYYFAYMPYAFMGAAIMSLSIVIMELKKKDIRRRMQSSAVPFLTQNLVALISFAVLGAAIWGICMVIQTFLYRGGVFFSNHTGYYLLNSIVFMLVSLSLAYLTGTVSNTPTVLNGMANVISLGFCFLGGIFVPVEMLGEKIEKVSRFLPTYWYSKTNGLLGDYGVLDAGQIKSVWLGIAIQVVFAAACIAVTMAIRQRQLQEKE